MKEPYAIRIAAGTSISPSGGDLVISSESPLSIVGGTLVSRPLPKRRRRWASASFYRSKITDTRALYLRVLGFHAYFSFVPKSKRRFCFSIGAIDGNDKWIWHLGNTKGCP